MKQTIGNLGEQIVGEWLQRQDYIILKQNWRCRWGEIDLIAQQTTNQMLAFVEVKTRSRRNWDENGLLAVDEVKQHKLWQTASMFLAQYPHLAELPCRFDVALVSYQSLKNTGESIYPAQLTIKKPFTFQNYQFTLENYLPAAFD
ncbi:hypothetical protein NIES4102_07440 [Chondrocystis sp. NIES-4102]|nr:hypothetical protein NIES4102_07440 [Chondrocystis sp. NIES-4102]